MHNTRGISITILLVVIVCRSPGRVSNLTSFVVCFFFLSLTPQVNLNAEIPYILTKHVAATVA